MAIIYKSEYSFCELGRVSNELLQVSDSVRIWFIYGEVGAGKTALVKSLCVLLGVASRVWSPTYSIVNEYTRERGGVVYHCDLYRVGMIKDAMQMGLEDIIESGEFCFIEWPNILRKISLAKDAISLHITVSPDGKRVIVAQKVVL